MESVYVVFFCNEWKDYASMRIVRICKNLSAVRRVIADEIYHGSMEVDGELEFYNNLPSLNSALTYGHVEQMEVLA